MLVPLKGHYSNNLTWIVDEYPQLPKISRSMLRPLQERHINFATIMISVSDMIIV